MKLWTGKTPRQEILLAAPARMALHGYSATEAICSCMDAWQDKPAGSVCHEVGRYVDRLSPAAWARLVADVTRRSKR